MFRLGQLVVEAVDQCGIAVQCCREDLAGDFHGPKAGVVQGVFGQVRQHDHAREQRMVVGHVRAVDGAVLQLDLQRELKFFENVKKSKSVYQFINNLNGDFACRMQAI